MTAGETTFTVCDLATQHACTASKPPPGDLADGGIVPIVLQGATLRVTPRHEGDIEIKTVASPLRSDPSGSVSNEECCQYVSTASLPLSSFEALN